MSRKESGDKELGISFFRHGTKIGTKNSSDLWLPRRAKLGQTDLFSYKLGMRNAEIVKASLLDKKKGPGPECQDIVWGSLSCLRVIFRASSLGDSV